MKKSFVITGLSGTSCASQVEKKVRALEGVADISVNAVTGLMRVSFDEKRVGDADIITAVTHAGYSAHVFDKKNAEDRKRKTSQQTFTRLTLVWIFTLVILYLTLALAFKLPIGERLSYPLPAGLVQLLLLVPVMILSRDIFSGGLKSLKNRAPNMYTLVSLGAIASAAYSVFELIWGAWRVSAGISGSMHLYFDTSAMILSLVALGTYFEARARRGTSAAISRLSRLRPETARRLENGKETVVQASEVEMGDTLIVRKGDIVPADGEVLSGAGKLDDSMFTGEMEAVSVSAGDEVMGASVCLSGEFTLRAVRPYKEMRLSQILSLVEEAASTKAPIARLADRVARIFVPMVLALSVATFVLWCVVGGDAAFAVKSAVCVLVVSCPGALGLATPTAIMAGTGKGAEMGILIKNAAAMERLNGITTVMFDKTGTLTAGEMRVTGSVLAEGTSMKTLLAIAASAEQDTRHPCGLAILREAQKYGIPLDPLEEFEDVPGQGVRARIGGMRVLIGNLTLMEQAAQDVSAWRACAGELADEGATAVFVASDGRVRGIIALKDELRPTALEAVKTLKGMNVSTLMLTGDDQRTADAIAAKAGVSEARSGLSPEEKDMMLRILQADGKKVMLVSDGSRDAPALARAELGVTVGSGTDVAIESADVVVMRGDMRLVAHAIQLGRFSMRVIRENLFWAFFYNVIGIPIAAGALYPLFGLQFSPALGAAAMSLSSICVVVNALRLRRFRPDQGETNEKTAKRLRPNSVRRNAEKNPESAALWDIED